MMFKPSCPKQTKLQSFYSFNIMCFVMLMLSTTSAASRMKCPFHHLFHFGDGFTDVGNSIYVKPYGPSLPAARLPYGMTFPGNPTGRWSNGLVIFDFAANYFGLPNITPYWKMNSSACYDGIIFSVARSTTLGHKFFASRGVNVPPYAVSLKVQLKWFKAYFKYLCSKREDCASILQNAVAFFGDIESNDLGYALLDGKSVEEVKAYIPFILKEAMHAAREMIMMGAKRVLIPESAPLGCYPYILTILSSNNPTDYDELGCLKSANALTLRKNEKLKEAVRKLRIEFPDTNIVFGKLYQVFRMLINQTMTAGPNALKACCGNGGKYNFDFRNFCGSPGVPVCSDPDDYVFWDGIHLTQEAIARMAKIIMPSGLAALNCTT